MMINNFEEDGKLGCFRFSDIFQVFPQQEDKVYYLVSGDIRDFAADRRTGKDYKLDFSEEYFEKEFPLQIVIGKDNNGNYFSSLDAKPFFFDSLIIWIENHMSKTAKEGGYFHPWLNKQ